MADIDVERARMNELAMARAATESSAVEEQAASVQGDAATQIAVAQQQARIAEEERATAAADAEAQAALDARRAKNEQKKKFRAVGENLLDAELTAGGVGTAVAGAGLIPLSIVALKNVASLVYTFFFSTKDTPESPFRPRRLETIPEIAKAVLETMLIAVIVSAIGLFLVFILYLIAAPREVLCLLPPEIRSMAGFLISVAGGILCK